MKLSTKTVNVYKRFTMFVFPAFYSNSGIRMKYISHYFEKKNFV